MTEQLYDAVTTKAARIGVVGLGFVGIPVAASFAAAKFKVVGVEANPEHVARLQVGALPVASEEPGLADLVSSVVQSGMLATTSDASALSDCDVVIVAVDTPIRSDHSSDTSQLETACMMVNRYVRPRALVVIESTLAPGTMRNVVAPCFHEKPELLLVHCPERVRPGRMLSNLANMGRLVGAEEPAALDVATALYRHVVHADFITSDWETAELTKTAENTVRDIQIAIANQLAVICDYAGVDFKRVRAEINRLWGREPLILEPGPGVGGHCLPKDPWLLLEHLPSHAASHLIEGARVLNDSMASHVVELVRQACHETGTPSSGARVALLGLTYSPDSGDARNAPAQRILPVLGELVGEVVCHDPYVPGQPLADALRDADVCLLVVPHREYVRAAWSELGAFMRRRVLVDCRSAITAEVARAAGFSHYALGSGVLSKKALAADGTSARS